MKLLKKYKTFSPRKKKLIVLISVVAVIGIVLAAYALWPEGPPAVAAAVIENGSIKSVIETSGTVSTDDSSTFTLPAGTYVKTVNVAVGSVVKRGDPLATFDTASLQPELAKKRSDYSSALAAYNEYKATVKNAKKSIPEIQNQIEELNDKIAKLEKEISDSEAQKETAASSTTTTAAAVDASLLEELSDLLQNIINIKGTVSDVNNMFNSFNSMNNTSFDVSSLMASSMDTPQNQLIQLQLQLVELNTKLTTLSATSEGSLDSVYKSITDKAYKDYTDLQDTVNKLSAGWFAEGDGVVTTVNVVANTDYQPASASASDIDVSTILSMLSGGADVGSLISSFLNSGDKNTGIEIRNYDGFVASITLDKYNLQQVKVGQEVRITSVNDSTFEGEVIFVAAEATESSSLDIASLAGSLTGGSGSSSGAICKIKIKNPDSTVVVGFDVDLEIVTAVVDNVPVVPVEAVRYDDKGMYVWVFDNDKKIVSKTYVTFGASEDTKYELLEGASLGDTILLNPPSSLEEGQKVTIQKDTEVSP